MHVRSWDIFFGITAWKINIYILKLISSKHGSMKFSICLILFADNIFSCNHNDNMLDLKKNGLSESRNSLMHELGFDKNK